MKNNTFKEIYDRLKGSKRVLMTLHTGPDGDSLGSSTAMKRFLEEEFDCKVTLISNDEIDEALERLPYSKEVKFGKDILDFDLSKFDLLFSTDICVPEMVGKLKKETEFLKKIFTISMDHHETNNYWADMNYVDKEAASACSIVLDFLREMKVKIDKEIASRLILGIYTDTNLLRVNFDYKKVFEDISYLTNCGADFYQDAVRPIMRGRPIRLKRYFAYIIENMKVNEKKRFGYSSVPLSKVKDLGLNVAEVRLGANELSDIKGLDFTFLLTETEEYIKGSFRSQGMVDVSALAERLGGGGHKGAAAFRLDNMALEEAEKRVLDVIKRFLR